VRKFQRVTNRLDYRLAALLAAVGGAFILMFGAPNTRAQPVSPDEGLRVFKSANCMGCHKWSGIGGGGYGGAAANLRQTSLSIEQIEQTIRCGRPGTGMPHFEADAYSDGHCYGLKASDLSDATRPPEPDHFLRPADVLAVANYVVTHVKGKAEPDFAQCQAFFGAGSRVCDTYEKRGGGQAATASPPSGSASSWPDPGSGSSGGHLKVETAPDANTPVDSVRK
jgi:Cytochrome C oxidase, cbb3-type, subunit III